MGNIAGRLTSSRLTTYPQYFEARAVGSRQGMMGLVMDFLPTGLVMDYLLQGRDGPRSRRQVAGSAPWPVGNPIIRRKGCHTGLYGASGIGRLPCYSPASEGLQEPSTLRITSIGYRENGVAIRNPPVMPPRPDGWVGVLPVYGEAVQGVRGRQALHNRVYPCGCLYRLVGRFALGKGCGIAHPRCWSGKPARLG